MESTLYKIGWIFAGISFLTFIILYFFPIPQPPCILRTLTGFYCPGCGGTRAVRELLQGHFIRSFYYHPYVPYAAVLYGWFMISQTAQRLFGGKLPIGMHYHDWFLYMGVGIILLNWVVRNLWIPIA